ncbi:MAG: cell division protein SepF [Cyanobium sp.]
MGLFSRLRSVVAGDDYLEGDYDDELDYDASETERTSTASRSSSSSSSSHNLGSNVTSLSTPPLTLSSDFGSSDDPFVGSNVIGLPGITTPVAEVCLLEPRSFDEMPRAIHALRERKTVILNLTMMEPDQAQRAVDFVAGGTFAIDGHQERVGESIFLFAPSCVTVTSSGSEEAASPTVMSSRPASPDPSEAAPPPAWARSDALG